MHGPATGSIPIKAENSRDVSARPSVSENAVLPPLLWPARAIFLRSGLTFSGKIESRPPFDSHSTTLAAASTLLAQQHVKGVKRFACAQYVGNAVAKSENFIKRCILNL